MTLSIFEARIPQGGQWASGEMATTTTPVVVAPPVPVHEHVLQALCTSTGALPPPSPRDAVEEHLVFYLAPEAPDPMRSAVLFRPSEACAVPPGLDDHGLHLWLEELAARMTQGDFLVSVVPGQCIRVEFPALQALVLQGLRDACVKINPSFAPAPADLLGYARLKAGPQSQQPRCTASLLCLADRLYHKVLGRPGNDRPAFDTTMDTM